MVRLAFSTKITLGLAVIALTIGYFSLPWTGPVARPGGGVAAVVCPAATMACPDGSRVGLVEGGCEFKSCPEQRVTEGSPEQPSRPRMPAEPLPTNWLVADVNDLGISFEYPADWGGYSIVNASTETGVSKSVRFSEWSATGNSPYWTPTIVSFASADASAGRSGSVAEVRAAKSRGLATSCDDLSANVWREPPCRFVTRDFGTVLSGVTPIFNDTAVGLVSFYAGEFPFISFEREYRSEADLLLIRRMVESVRQI